MSTNGIKVGKTLASIQHGRIKDGQLTFQEGIWVTEDGFFAIIKNIITNKYYVLRGAGSKNNYGLSIGQVINFSKRYGHANYVVVSFHKKSTEVYISAPLINLK